jgi:hypothetical protein
MMMRVNPVIIINMAGKKDIMVSKTNVCTLSDQVWLPFWLVVDVIAGSVACASELDGYQSSARSRPSRAIKDSAGARELCCTVVGRMVNGT